MCTASHGLKEKFDLGVKFRFRRSSVIPSPSAVRTASQDVVKMHWFISKLKL